MHSEIQPSGFAACSGHAHRCMAQRNINGDVIELVLSAYDLETPCGQGRLMVRISERASTALIQGGDVSATTAHAARGVHLILSPMYEVITTYRDDPRKRRRRPRPPPRARQSRR